MIREYLKNNILITDGAMGTYYSEITGDNISFCEFANIDKPEIIKRIHMDYIESGAKLIRTNTFSANTITLGISRKKVRQLIEKGYVIAKQAAEGKDVFVAASIGPIYEASFEKDNLDVLEEYKFIVDTFLELGTNIFIFETFSSVDYIKEISEYIKQKNNSAFILTQFAITPDGFTRKGISVNRIVNEVKSLRSIDAYGFNCGSGPTHLHKILKKLDISNEIVSVLPNSGYSELINERTVYVNNPDYFADIMADIKNLGVKIIGGCCGTKPSHIKKIVDRLKVKSRDGYIDIPTETAEAVIVDKKSNTFLDKLLRNEFVVAVELDPPFDTSIDKIIHGAKISKENGVDLITVADSPMSKVRVDSIMIAAKIKREIGIDTMPHICCRDKNQNAIRSGLLAAHIEGIRNILAVTGDPLSDQSKLSTKSVFNLNSFKLIDLISEMNKEVFAEDKINIGGALNLNVRNKDIELSRMFKKVEKGATFFLTQPIFDEKVIEYLSNMKREKHIKILGGLMPLVSYRNAQFLNNEVPGIHIPQTYIDRFDKDMTKEEAEEVGINLAVEIGNRIKKYVDGIYLITPFNRIEMVMKVLNKIK
ncbi:bifunctional homocysteine S-methyltransferase/5,10-methylenetetrahydrofolate reductase [Clostridium polyendosporum]|uniref:Bifunctional homocysteine S-methyltransferase/5,10-methylenetetrahydrofolate reductase n=1 Tax=Clostridium polyendosporum TaxID=69208 RepID=A0A919RYW2_9CLOT|nr:bifunctional homocysteine S-methyltransferase/methylenetetrahydrofolate reductase [Clostridium polyendosporum]GIM28256.1 bifunctional homocysteine S-methyltransferase/5,10-methylenetetrahydrofolate reductase [Clostridium polyendosporum]